MTKKLLIILALVVAVFALSVNARVVPQDPRLEKIKQFLPSVALDDGTNQGVFGAGHGGRTISLGVAQPGVVNSRGAVVTQTWRDWMSNSSINRTVSVAPTTSSSGANVQFSYMSKASKFTADRTRWGWAGYDPYAGAGGSFVGPNEIVQNNDPGSLEAGSYPKIFIEPKDGRAFIGSYDFPDQLNSPNDIQLHVVFDALPLAGNFAATIGDGERVPDSVSHVGNLDTPTTPFIWPAYGVTVSGTDTAQYLFGFENSTLQWGAVKVFRRLGTVAANPDVTWQLVFRDSSWFPTCEFAASHNSKKVAAVWTRFTGPGAVSGDTGDMDVWYATSTDGTSGTWTATNLTNYSGDTYRAWMETSALYDSADKLHIIWNASVTTGATHLRRCRLMHWSEYNPTNFYTVYNAEFDPLATACVGGSNVMNVGKVSIGECDNKLYVTFTSWNDPADTTGGANTTDDCAKNAAINLSANGELYLCVSKTLQGTSFDKPRNLSNSYAKDCDTIGDCADDRWGCISERGIDDAAYAGTEKWTSADAAGAKYDPSGAYVGTKYTEVWYLQDRFPGGGILASPQGPLTLNDYRWIRLACVEPVTAAALSVTPSFIDYPTYTKPSVQKTVPLTLENTGNTTLTFSGTAKNEDSCKGPGCGPTGWLDVTGVPATIVEAGTSSASLLLNKAGVITAGPTSEWGRVVFSYGPPAQTLTMQIRLVIADSIKNFTYDSIATSCAVKLAVGNNGNMGNNYIGDLNMGTANTTKWVECDTGSVVPYISRGDASIYLGDASPVVVRKVGAAPARASWSIFSQGLESPNGLKPLAINPTMSKGTTVHYDSVFSGVFCTVDSLVKIQKTWYSPKVADSCMFIVQKMQVFPYTIASAVTNLQIGEAFDWDIPSDSGNGTSNGGSANSTGFNSALRMVWARGYNSADTVTDCFNNSLRWGVTAFQTMNFKNKAVDTVLYGAYSAANDSFVYPASGFVPEQTWNNMKNPGYSAEPRITDIHMVFTYKGGATGFTLPANDTLTIYTAMGSLRNPTGTPASVNNPEAQVDSVNNVVIKARKWKEKWLTPSNGCCVGPVTGNVNMAGIVDLGDLSALVSYLTGGGYILPCVQEANVNNAGIVDLGDLSALVSYLTGGGFVLPNCP